MVSRWVGRGLDKLYEYDLVRAVKARMRPLKHMLLGKSDVYWVCDVIRRSRAPGDPVRLVFDVGAATGDKTLAFLKAFPAAIVYAFEPQGEAFERLRRRTSASDRVRYFNFGLYERSGEMLLRLCSYRDASSILPMAKFLELEGKIEVGQESIAVRTLDEVVAEGNVGRIDLLKIDVEGVELEVLEGGRSTLSEKTESVYVEISPLRSRPRSDRHIDIFRLLQETGFTFMGCYGDYFFTKDGSVLSSFFETGGR